MFKRFLHYYRPYILILIIDLLCASLSTVCEMVFPMIVRYITNMALQGDAALLMSSVIKLGALYLFLRIVDTIVNYYMAYIGHVMGAKIEADMREDFFKHLQRLSFSFYDNAKVGDIMSRVTNDLFDVTEFSHHCPEEYFIASIKIIGTFVILGSIDLQLTLIIFALLPLMAVSAILFRKKMKKAFKKSRVRIGGLNSTLEDSLLGIRVVKSFANEEIEKEKFGTGNRLFLSIKSEAYKYMARFQAGTRFFDGMMYVCVIVIGSYYMKQGKINSADLIAFLLFITMLLASVRKIVEFTEQFQKGITGIERFYEIMDIKPDICDSPGAVELEGVEGSISFKNVSFSYGEGTDRVLNNINVEVKKGESIAIVGPSGGGKTTLCSLVPRFYDVDSGEILIDGVNIKSITLSSLRKNIGVVQQDVYLFSGTVAENIVYGKPEAEREEVVSAAKNAGAHDFIMTLPDGYDTYVGERGVKLSGGQKQRISIARLFLKNPPVLILDEATSALDNESEMLVQKSLERLAKNRTTFTIAHRLTTIRNADRILVLTEKGIVEAGSHEELIKLGGEYKKLYSLYEVM
ncbi:MAG: ABC transporter ATP-binding protein [Oscillospiraceae bacterium]|jgi:ATP-binding cassette subfamily B protein